jgi:hypothetical protein
MAPPLSAPAQLTLHPHADTTEDATPTLWVATDLSSIVRPAGELGPHRRDLVLVDAGKPRVYRHLDALWLGWLTIARQRAQAQYDQGRIEAALWQQLEARWSMILAWASEHALQSISPPSHYPAPSVHDRWSDGLVTWRRRHPEYSA